MENHGKRTARLASFSWFHLRGILSVMAQQRHVLLPHHDAVIGGNDPSELLVMGPRALFEPCVAKGEGLPCGVRSWEGWRCGYHATQFIYWAYSNGIMPFFYFTDLKLHLLRLDGDIRRIASNNTPTTRNDVCAAGTKRCACRHAKRLCDPRRPNVHTLCQTTTSATKATRKPPVVNE